MKKKYIIVVSLLLITGSMSFGQSSDQLVSTCVMNAGENAKYLKDFRVQLGKASAQTEPRYKANMSLWKNTKYRFSMCNADDSKGKLILSIKDESNKIVLSSYDKNSGKIYPYVDFTCNKSGIYQLNYDFTDGQQGSGVGVVSMVR
jgi:major membrane immunogen (membrane-anchored lipoprotein)